ncbi:cbb3-type cytochrome c oxidase subunit II [Synoicihabitans lomoniglobus]|uniref:Cbb3-type cytochrome c oxidase subunit II n=1 Tax=Synoicihabitans lomoniglobus TaxID=2909285 RepID=A0AAF0I408_9BACT|nr:cbb3-type cytochrome c oxidase subunit II [Opitutaceae bacterium LMO-M01]WED66479.1 cbb3-type cytochrome c oxidase subunit II [Opitutaceae bacterium LMO-M01]
MNRAPLIFLGVFVALAFSWTGIILTNQVAYGNLTPYYDETEEAVFPVATPGLAARGQLVYQDLGCVYCHTQQVRRPGYGSDIERGWGERQSVARDYIREKRVMLGTMRTGPDLRNIGARQADPTWHMLHLYDPQITSRGSNMPPFRFLFEQRKIIGEASPDAITLPTSYVDGTPLPPHSLPAEGYELVPTERAKSLVAYLINRKDTYAYPETFNVFPEDDAGEAEAKTESEGEGH